VRIQNKCLVPIYVFLEMKLLFPKQNNNVLSRSSYTHISVRDFNISRINLPILLQEIWGPILGIQGGSDKSGIFFFYFQMTQHSWKSSDLIEVKANLHRYISRISLMLYPLQSPETLPALMPSCWFIFAGM
jgi:hypothetical protein